MHSRTTTTLFVVAASILFFAGFFMVRFPEEASHPVPGMMAVLLIALPSFVGVYQWLGTRRGILLLSSLAVFAYAIEFIGVTTGFPYSPFSYGDALGPVIFGAVPLILPFAYIPLVLGAVALAWPLRERVPLFVLTVALMLTAIDLVLDPGAVALGHWSFAFGGAYYDVPVYNFLGWLLSGSFAALLVTLLVDHKKQPPLMLGASAVLQLVFWTGIALWYAMSIPLGIGIVLLLFCGAVVRSRLFSSKRAKKK